MGSSQVIENWKISAIKFLKASFCTVVVSAAFIEDLCINTFFPGFTTLLLLLKNPLPKILLASGNLTFLIRHLKKSGLLCKLKRHENSQFPGKIWKTIFVYFLVTSVFIIRLFKFLWLQWIIKKIYFLAHGHPLINNKKLSFILLNANLDFRFSLQKTRRMILLLTPWVIVILNNNIIASFIYRFNTWW